MICLARASIGELRALSERLLMQRGAPEDAARLQARASRPSEPGQSVAIPGDGGRRRRARALATGIELPDEIMEKLAALDAA